MAGLQPNAGQIETREIIWYPFWIVLVVFVELMLYIKFGYLLLCSSSKFYILSAKC
jgi:hypothetical protein